MMIGVFTLFYPLQLYSCPCTVVIMLEVLGPQAFLYCHICLEAESAFALMSLGSRESTPIPM